MAAAMLIALATTASIFWATQSYLCGSWYNIFDELSCPTPLELVKNGRNQSAAERGDLEQVRALISSGLSPTEANEMLFAAISNDRVKAARVLIENGARDVPRGSQPSAFDMAARNGNFEIVRLLLVNGAKPDGYRTSIELEKMRSRDIAVPDFDPETPFYHAMNCLLQPNYIVQSRGPPGCLRVATLLAKHGATMAGGQAIDVTIGSLRGRVRWKAVTILLAVAHHSGRFEEALQRMLDATDPIENGGGFRANPAANFRSALEAIARCKHRQFVPAMDHYELCAS